jgi:hypothetical protein
MFRITLRPHVRSGPGLYRSVLSGMANSASQPRSVVLARTVQSASQLALNPLTCPRWDPPTPDASVYGWAFPIGQAADGDLRHVLGCRGAQRKHNENGNK